MPKFSYRWAVALLIGLSAAMAASASAAEPAAIKADPQELVIGDWYEVSTKLRPEGEEPGSGIEGVLVKATDDWIVLGTVTSETGEVFRFPVMAYLFMWCEGETLFENYPLLAEVCCSDIFMKRVTDYTKNYLWLPRATTKIIKRTSEVSRKVNGQFKNDEPTLKPKDEAISSHVVSVAGDKVTHTYGSTFTLEAGELTVVGQEVRVTYIEDPLWSKLPIIGHNFSKRRVFSRDVVHGKFPFDRVSYICQQVPYMQREVGRVDEKLGAN